MIYVVLGMHKSGTTLVSEILHHSGINMIGEQNTQMTYDQKNYYERKATHTLNGKILKARRFINGFCVLDLPAPDKLEITEKLRSQIQELILDCDSKYQSWGFKDPRNCFTYSVWASELPEHKIIAIYRSPYESWPRFRGRLPILNSRRFYDEPIRAWRYINRWCEYNNSILAAIKTNKIDSILLSHRRLMTVQFEFDRLQEFIGHELVDRRVKNLWRNRPTKDPIFQLILWLASKRTPQYSPPEIVRQFADIHYQQRKHIWDS